MKLQEILVWISLGLVVSIAFPITPKEQVKVSSNGIEKYNNTFYCAICEFLVNQGEEFITSNTTEEDAVGFLDTVCHRMPKRKQLDCNIFIKENYTKLIKFIVGKESAVSVCSKMKFCESHKLEINECSFCKYATHRIDRFLSHNNTLTDIIEYGEMFCNNLHDRYVYQCTYVISMYYSQIVAKLVDHHSFVDVCDALNLCRE